MIFVLTLLAWFSLTAAGIGLIVVTEPWWNRAAAAARPVAVPIAPVPIALEARRREPRRPRVRPVEDCWDCAA